jgi:hypothetical protein
MSNSIHKETVIWNFQNGLQVAGVDVGTGGSGGGGGGLVTVEVTGTAVAMASSQMYIMDNVALVTATLPTTCALGDVIEVIGKGAGGWRISQNAGQLIHFGATPTTTGTGGFIASQHRYNALSLRCITANTEWIVLGAQGSMTIN